MRDFQQVHVTVTLESKSTATRENLLSDMCPPSKHSTLIYSGTLSARQGS